MSKWYEVSITTTTVYAVEVADDEGQEDARQYAIDEADGFGDSTVSDEIVGEEDIDRVRRHADEVLELDEHEERTA